MANPKPFVVKNGLDVTGAATISGRANIAGGVTGALGSGFAQFGYTTITGAQIIGQGTSADVTIYDRNGNARIETSVTNVNISAATTSISGVATIGSGSTDYVQLAGGTNIADVSVQGASTNATLRLTGKGTGGIQLVSGGVSPTTFYTGSTPAIQFRVSDTPSAVNYLQVTGGTAGGNPVISVQGADANRGITMVGKGTAATLGLNRSGSGIAVAWFDGTNGANFGSDAAGRIYMQNSATADISLITGGGEQFRVANTATAVNYLQVTGGIAGNRVTISAQGADVNRGITYSAVGNESHDMRVNGSSQLVVSGPAAGYTNYMQITGAPTGSAPTLSTGGSVDTNRSLNVTAAGLGSVFLKANNSGSISFVASPSSASDVNYLIANASVTGGAVTLSTGGTDTNRSINITPAGTGTVTVANLVSTGLARKSAASGVAAAGSTQGTATNITTNICSIATATAGTAFGVILPSIAGAQIIVVNTTAVAINVYPPVGGAVDTLAINTAFSLPAGGKIMFLSSTASQYFTLNATYA